MMLNLSDINKIHHIHKKIQIMQFNYERVYQGGFFSSKIFSCYAIVETISLN